MKKLLFLALGAGWMPFPGCAPSYIKVLDRKGPTTPFTNIFAFYVDEACNFSLADSTGYNICLKASFNDLNSVAGRSRVERLIASSLATKGTAILSSANLLGVNGAGTNTDDSYSYFRKLMDSLHIDGILVVQQRFMEKEYYRTPVAGGAPAGRSAAPFSIQSTVDGELDHVTFDCYLLQPKDLNNPVWKAELETKGAATTHELNHSMTRALAKSLIDDGYIVR